LISPALFTRVSPDLPLNIKSARFSFFFASGFFISSFFSSFLSSFISYFFYSFFFVFI